MKRTKLRRKSKSSIRQVQDELWSECRRIAKEQFSNQDGTIDCYTCHAKNLLGSNCHLGHVPWAKASLGAFLKYDVFRVLKWQCARCNLFLGGNSAEAYKRMLKEEGKSFMDKLEKDRNVSVKAINFYTQLLIEYKKIMV